MKNKFNNRKNILRNIEKHLDGLKDPIEVELISLNEPNDQTIMITDWNGVVVLFPTALVKANGLIVKDGRLGISQSLYDTWFREKVQTAIEQLSQKLFDNFDKVVDGASVILNDKEFRNIKLPFLKSTILYSNSLHYSLGSLLESWLSSDELSVSEDTYMLKMNVSPLTGLNNYTAYSIREKSLVNGSLQKGKRHWLKYIIKFQCLVSSKQNKSDLLAITRLVQELKIE